MTLDKKGTVTPGEISIFAPGDFSSTACNVMANSTQFVLNGLSRQFFHNSKQMFESPIHYKDKIQIIQQDPKSLLRGFAPRLFYQFAGVGAGKSAVKYAREEKEVTTPNSILTTIGATVENIYGSLGEIFQSKSNLKGCPSIASFQNSLYTARCLFPVYQVRNMMLWSVLVDNSLDTSEKITKGFIFGTISGIPDGAGTHIMRNYNPASQSIMEAYSNAWKDLVTHPKRYLSSAPFRGLGGAGAVLILSENNTRFLSSSYNKLWNLMCQDTTANTTSKIPSAQTITNHTNSPLINPDKNQTRTK